MIGTFPVVMDGTRHIPRAVNRTGPMPSRQSKNFITEDHGAPRRFFGFPRRVLNHAVARQPGRVIARTEAGAVSPWSSVVLRGKASLSSTRKADQVLGNRHARPTLITRANSAPRV